MSCKCLLLSSFSMEKAVGHHVHDHPSSTPHTQLAALHVQGGEERRRRSFASFPTEHIPPACPFCLGLCPFPPRPSHSPRSVLISASPLPSCRPSRHSLALLPFTNHLAHTRPSNFCVVRRSSYLLSRPSSPFSFVFSCVAAVIVVTPSYVCGLFRVHFGMCIKNEHLNAHLQK